jgi:hypothetical protein
MQFDLLIWIGISTVVIGVAVSIQIFVVRKTPSETRLRRVRSGIAVKSEPISTVALTTEHLQAFYEISDTALSDLSGDVEPDDIAASDQLVGSAREIRIKGEFWAMMRQQGGKPIKVRVWDLSAGGFSAEWPHKLQRNDRVWLTIKGTVAQAAFVAWAQEFTIGCKFEKRLHNAVLKQVIESAARGLRD